MFDAEEKKYKLNKLADAAQLGTAVLDAVNRTQTNGALLKNQVSTKPTSVFWCLFYAFALNRQINNFEKSLQPNRLRIGTESEINEKSVETRINVQIVSFNELDLDWTL